MLNLMLETAFFDLVIKSLVMNEEINRFQKMHKGNQLLCTGICTVKMMRTIQEHLTEERHGIYKRGRNAKSVSPAKNQSITDYRRATGFEALMGYLYLKKDWKRLLDLVKIGLCSVSDRSALKEEE